MGNFNKVTLLGNLTRDPELEELGENREKKVAKFTVAVNREAPKADGEKSRQVSYIDCKAYGKLGEAISSYFQKGRPILVDGRLKQERWEKEGKNFSKVVVITENFVFVDKKKDNGNGAEEAAGVPVSVDDEEFDLL
jgi:single-strand DNA-binding protein